MYFSIRRRDFATARRAPADHIRDSGQSGCQTGHCRQAYARYPVCQVSLEGDMYVWAEERDEYLTRNYIRITDRHIGDDDICEP